MTNAPDRIWIEDEFGEGDDDQWTYGTWDVRNYMGYDVEYVRADIVQALTAERDEALECNEQFFVDNQFLKKRVEKAEAERDRLREALSMIAVMGFSSSHEVSSNIGRMAVEQARAALKGESND